MIAAEHLPHALFVAVYLLALIGVGALKARKVRSQEDFSLAGRGLSAVVLVGTLLATWIGTGSIFGNAEKTYGVGVAGFLLPVGGVLGIGVLYLLSGRIRTFGQYTIQDILEARFGVATRIAGTVTLLLAYVIIVSYQYRAGAAVLLYLSPELGPGTAQCLVAGFVILYTALAGMYSVAYTDVANGVLMTIGIALALPFLWRAVGGAEGAREALGPEALDLFGTYTGFELVSYILPSFLLLVGDANMYQRFFSARSVRSARASAAWLLLGALVLECAIVAVAVLGKALVAKGVTPEPANPGHVVVHLAFGVLPAWLGAMLVATVVAVVVSTADSYLLAPATSLVRDVYRRFLAPDADERRTVLVGRLVVVILGVGALGLSFTSDAFFDVALFAYTIYGAGITPVLLAAFFWRRATRTGALSAMLTGAGTAVVWFVGVERGGAARLADSAGLEGLAGAIRTAAEIGVDAVVPAVAVSCIVLVVVSLAGEAPDPAHARTL